MAYKDKERAREYYREYYFKKKKPKYVPHPRTLLTREEKLERKREWYRKNAEKCKEAVKKYTEANKEKVSLRNKIWRDKNRERLREESRVRGKKWYEENKDRKISRGKIWREKNPERSKEISKRYRDNNQEKVKLFEERNRIKPKSRYNQAKSCAKRRGYIFELSLEHFLEIISKPCTYCGESEQRIGIDRIDNSIGYTVGNSTPCCKKCNMMKKDLILQDFLGHAQKIVLHNFKK